MERIETVIQNCQPRKIFQNDSFVSSEDTYKFYRSICNINFVRNYDENEDVDNSDSHVNIQDWYPEKFMFLQLKPNHESSHKQIPAGFEVTEIVHGYQMSP